MTETRFPEIDSEGWLDGLADYQRRAIDEQLQAGRSAEEVAEKWLNHAGADANAAFGVGGALKSYFANLLGELDAFVCGDSRYEKEQAEATALWDKGGKPALVAFAATAIAPQVGLAAVAIVPAVALMFSVIGKAGLAAYCTTRGRPLT